MSVCLTWLNLTQCEVMNKGVLKCMCNIAGYYDGMN